MASPRTTAVTIRARAAMILVGAALVSGLVLSGCGGSSAVGAGRGLILLSFEQESVDNVALNTVLVWRFSADVMESTVTNASIQIREGRQFGLTVAGVFKVDGATVTFEPDLPGLCDGSDGGFKADTQYRVQLTGFPEEFGIRNVSGQALSETSTHEFHTRLETDPQLYTDQVPSAGPMVLTSSPADGAEAVKVEDGNRVVLTISENLRPCSVDATTALFYIFQFGDPNRMVAADGGSGNPSGFATDASSDTSDQTPLDPFTWTTPAAQALATTLPQPQLIVAHIDLDQSFDATRIVVTPDFGYNPNPSLNRSRFPEDALVVLRLTFGVTDFGGVPLTPFTLAFTTENLPKQDSVYTIDTKGETPWDRNSSTARIIETGVGVVQGYLLFAGDGDNGAVLTQPSLPQSDASCTIPYQANDGTGDDFDPTADVLLDTGSTANICPNGTDGSFAVVWEFSSFRIRSGVTVRLVGVNPAIILSQGDVLIEAGGRLLARGDNQGGAPRGYGEGGKTATTTDGCKGGVGVAGGGAGGECEGGNGAGTARYSGHGVQGYYHTTDNGPLAPNVGTVGVGGAGHGNTSAFWSTQTTNNRNTPSGGGGGHATKGVDGTALNSGSSPTSLDLAVDGAGGAVYGTTTGRMRSPEAGSGGGAGAELRPFSGNSGRGPGGGGGAGGGFIDLTSAGNIIILGSLDAAGGNGGSNPGGNFNPNYTFNPGTGGGGGGSGGGIRLLTPNDIIIGATTVLTAAGGAGGAGGQTQGAPATPNPNNGGDGGAGRIALEDGNSVIAGLAGANVSPSEGSPGFYRGVFDATRFQGGGTRPSAVSKIFAVGPFNPVFYTPNALDFVVYVPAAASPGGGKTVMLMELRGYQMLPDGTPDVTGVIAPPTDWHTVGHFRDSGVETAPSWQLTQPPLAEVGGALPAGNNGTFGIGNLDGYEFIQVRVTFYLKDTISATEPGHAMDVWRIRFSSDQ